MTDADLSTATAEDQKSIYAEELWWLMNHSDEDVGSVATVLACYVDDSGSEEPSAIVILGGQIMDKSNFIRFDSKWKNILHRFPSAFHSYDRLCSPVREIYRDA